MQKCHIHSLRRTGKTWKTLASITGSSPSTPQDFHTASPFQNVGQDQVVQEVASPLPNRAKRLHASTKEVENLYYQHAAKDNIVTNLQDKTFQYVPTESVRRSQFDGQNAGSPLSQKAIEDAKSRFESQRKPSYRRFVPNDHSAGIIDARSFAADPRAREGVDNGHLSTGRTERTNGRVARTEILESGLDTKDSSTNTRTRRQDTHRLEEKHRFPTRQNNRSFQGDGERRHPSSMTIRFQAGSARQTSGRGDVVRNADRTTNDDAQTSRQPARFRQHDPMSNRGRSFPQSNEPNNRSGRPRASRSNDGSKPSRHQRGRPMIGNNEPTNSRRSEPTWTEEELSYFETKRKAEGARTVDHNPEEMTEATFSGFRPALLSGEQGMNEVLGERLLLAKRHLEGEYVEWESKELKAEVMTLVQRLKGIDTVTIGERSNGSQFPNAEVEKETQSLLQRLLGGAYQFNGPQQGKGILAQVARHADKNESYFPEDQKSLLDKVKSLMPQDNSRTGGKGMKASATK